MNELDDLLDKLKDSIIILLDKAKDESFKAGKEEGFKEGKEAGISEIREKIESALDSKKSVYRIKKDSKKDYPLQPKKDNVKGKQPKKKKVLKRPQNDTKKEITTTSDTKNRGVGKPLLTKKELHELARAEAGLGEEKESKKKRPKKKKVKKKPIKVTKEEVIDKKVTEKGREALNETIKLFKQEKKVSSAIKKYKMSRNSFYKYIKMAIKQGLISQEEYDSKKDERGGARYKKKVRGALKEFNNFYEKKKPEVKPKVDWIPCVICGGKIKEVKRDGNVCKNCRMDADDFSSMKGSYNVRCKECGIGKPQKEFRGGRGVCRACRRGK